MDSPTDLGDLLSSGTMEVEGRMPNSSNGTFLVTFEHEGQMVRAIYKPLRAERPLWDFEPGLHKREVAAYRLSEAMGLHFVPMTVLGDGPLGEGSIQLFVDYDHTDHYFTLLENRPETHDALRTMAIFDIVANNTDRKAGHVLADAGGRIWGIDHGLCFSADFKLRTVIWDFAGEQVDESLLDAVGQLMADVPAGVASLLDDEEVDAMMERCRWLVEHRVFPAPGSRYEYPWPMI